MRRRTLIKGAALAACAVGMPFVRRAAAAERSLRVATFGGYLESGLARYLYPEFEAASGIRIQSVARTDGAAAAGLDLITVSQDELTAGAALGLWRGLDAGRIANIGLLHPRFVHKGPAGLDGIGATAWYQTLVLRPGAFHATPDSWKILWEPGRSDAWGLAAGGRSALFEIAAATWFGDTTILDTEAGILEVMAKIEALRPGVRLWWDTEGMMRTAYEDGGIAGGMYFHDVARLMARDGTDIASVFPKEGAVLDFGSWCQPVSSGRTEEVREFLSFMCSPAAQALMTRKIGTPLLIDRGSTDLTDAEFAAVAGEGRSIPVAAEARARHGDFMDRQFARMLVS